jgi:hypothetical protein
MSTAIVYIWSAVRPGVTVGVYVHGYQNQDVAVFSTSLFDTFSGGNFAINLTQGIMRKHVDGTPAKEAWVENRGESVSVALTELFETIQP